MDTENLMKAIIASVLMIVVVMVVVVPVISDTNTDGEGRSTPNYYYTDAYDCTITSSGGNIIIDGKTVPIGSGVALISDSLVIMHTNQATMRLMDYGSGTFGTISSITISGDSYTTTGATEATGTIGTDALIFTDDSEAATHGQFRDASFYLNKDAKIRSFRASITMSDGDSGTADARILAYGTIDSLTAQAVSLSGSVYTPYTTFSAEVLDTSYTEPNDKVYSVAGNAAMSYEGTLSGTTYTGTAGLSGGNIVAPLDYVKVSPTGSAISSMISIVPLLLIVGAIMMIIGIAIVRR